MNKSFLYYACFLAVFLFKNTLQAQNISGQVTSPDKHPIGGASVLLLRLKDSTAVSTVIAEENGKFLFSKVKESDYLVSIVAPGYKKYYSAVIHVHTQNIELSIISLPLAATKELASVTVTANKPFTEQKIDRTVVNVDALISNTGTNALEVLEKTPGVTVDENGNISFKGKTNVLVMIDDKPTYLSAADLATYLRSLPSSALDKIELMDNPPAKYDASGNGGVINIKTRKSKAKGFNGSLSVSAGQSFYARTNESLNMNYNTGKINLFANIGYNIQKGMRELYINRDYYDASGNLASAFKQTNFFTPLTKSPNAKIGLDLYASSNTTWGIVYTGSVSNRNEYRPTFSSLYDATGTLDSSIKADNRSVSSFHKNGINLNYTHKFDSTGKILSFDMDYIKYSSVANQTFDNSTFLPAGGLESTQNIIAQLPSNISIYAAKIDYTQPLQGKAKLEAGAKTSYVTSDNEANYFNVENGISSIDYNNTNHFIYKENINAAYLNFTKDLKRLSLQFGLRAENTNGNGHQLGNSLKPDSAFAKHYTNLFPTAYLSYKLDSSGTNLLNFAYGRRIDRPNYQDLNPFVFILDKFTAFSGNPFLRPQFSNDYKVSFTHKNKFTLSAQYIHTTDIQIETIEQNGNVFTSRNGNIGTWNYIVFSLETTLHPARWWTVNSYTDFFNYQEYSGQVYTEYLHTKTVYLFAQMTNQFNLGKDWSAELGGFYCSPRQQAQFNKIAFGQLNTGLQKKVLHNKGSVRFNVRDIFNTNTSTGFITNVPNVISHYENRFHNQTFTIGFTYSFGKQINTQKRKIGSADTEAGRVGN